MVLSVLNSEKAVGKTTIAIHLSKSNNCLYVTNAKENLSLANSDESLLINTDENIPKPSTADNVVFDLNGELLPTMKTAIENSDYIIIPTYSSSNFRALMEFFNELYKLNKKIMFIINKVPLNHKYKYNKDYLFKRRIITFLNIKRYDTDFVKVQVLHEKEELKNKTLEEVEISSEFKNINRYFKQRETFEL